jgi:hypothetical protein
MKHTNHVAYANDIDIVSRSLEAVRNAYLVPTGDTISKSKDEDQRSEDKIYDCSWK